MSHFDRHQADLVALGDLLLTKFRKELREKMLAVIEPDIEAALDAACAGFKAEVSRSIDPMSRGLVLSVAITRVAGTSAPPEAS